MSDVFGSDGWRDRNSGIDEPEWVTDVVGADEEGDVYPVKPPRLDSSPLDEARRGLPPEAYHVPEYRNCRVYINSDDAITAVRIAFASQRVMEAIGLYRIELRVAEHGSVILRFKAWTKRFVEKREVRVVASQLVQTAEAMTVDKALSENASKNASAVAELIAAAKGVDGVSLDFGSLQYAQYIDDDGKVQIRSRSLSSHDIAEKRLTEHQLKDPREAWKVLDAGGGIGPEATA